jgi:hypothetical protein
VVFVSKQCVTICTDNRQQTARKYAKVIDSNSAEATASIKQTGAPLFRKGALQRVSKNDIKIIVDSELNIACVRNQVPHRRASIGRSHIHRNSPAV